MTELYAWTPIGQQSQERGEAHYSDGPMINKRLQCLKEAVQSAAPLIWYCTHASCNRHHHHHRVELRDRCPSILVLRDMYGPLAAVFRITITSIPRPPQSIHTMCQMWPTRYKERKVPS